MEHKSDIIVFGEDFGRHPSSTQHIIRQLNNGRKVVWVNSIGLRSPKINLHDIKRAVYKAFRMFSTNKKQNITDITVINPKAIPAPSNILTRVINRYLLRKMVRGIITSHDLNNVVLWLSLPTAIDAVIDPEMPVIYYCCDDFSSLAGVDHAVVSNMEQECANRANSILVSSNVLSNKFPSEKTHIIEHGVDLEMFSSSYPTPNDLPKNKTIGFYGSIAQWIDTELLYHAAKKLHDYNFVFIGNVKTNIDALKSLPNVSFLGAKEHHELSAYAHNMDVLLIPFRNNAQIHACNPLKLREYMASGTPIVTTIFPAMEQYRNLLYPAATIEEFISAIEAAYHEGKSNSDIRQQAVQQDSWSNRGLQIEKIMEEL